MVVLLQSLAEYQLIIKSYQDNEESCIKNFLQETCQKLMVRMVYINLTNHVIDYWGVPVILISIEGTLRLPTTYDNHPNPIPSTYSCEDNLGIEDVN